MVAGLDVCSKCPAQAAADDGDEDDFDCDYVGIDDDDDEERQRRAAQADAMAEAMGNAAVAISGLIADRLEKRKQQKAAEARRMAARNAAWKGRKQAAIARLPAGMRTTIARLERGIEWFRSR